MKKIYRIIYSVLFFSMCIIPGIAYVFTKSTDNIEKSNRVNPPAIVKDGQVNEGFGTDFEAFLNSKMPFRAELVSIGGFIKTELFHTTASNVTPGKEGWVFHNTTLDNYVDNNSLNEYELNSMVVTLSLIQEGIHRKGGNFLFVPAMNKNEIYSEYMPSSYKKAETNDYSRLIEKLNNSDVKFVDMKNVLLDAKSNRDINLYYKKDTHWNTLGAYYGADAIIRGLGKNFKVYNNTYTVSKDYRGDLDKLLYPVGGNMDDYINLDYSIDDFDFIDPAGVTDKTRQLAIFMSDREENDEKFQTAKVNATGQSKLYMVRDSFGRALLPFMIDNYDEATFVRTMNPAIETIPGNTDMVYEIVQRNIKRIIATAPYLKAPLREIEVESQISEENENNTGYVVDEGYALRIYGTVDEKLLGEDSRIYVQLTKEDATISVEAFPIYEAEMLRGCNSVSKIGYSLFLDKELLNSGIYDISVVSGKVSTGKICSYDVTWTVEKTDDNKENAEEKPEDKEQDSTDNGSEENSANAGENGSENGGDNGGNDAPTYFPDLRKPFTSDGRAHTGWRIENGNYQFYDRITGEKKVDTTIDGIVLDKDGNAINLTEYDKGKIETMMKAHELLDSVTEPGDSMTDKRKKAFDQILSYPYLQYRSVRDCYEQPGIELVFANDIFDTGWGDCVSESAALAFLFHEIGYENVEWVHDTGHSWVWMDGKLYDPLFAEARDYYANYDAECNDYRQGPNHRKTIY